jgi:tRNA(Arg) A34 adenosine deaminase TadA
MNHLIKIALKAAKRSNHRQHSMASLVIRGGAVISIAHNLVKKDRQPGKGHCEIRALRPTINAKGATIIVVRQGGGISKPCESCRAAIIKAGIKKVVYMDIDGNVTIEKL